MTHPLLSETFRQWIEKQIEAFEKQTSCEIRIHIEKSNDYPLMDRAAFVFDHLGMKKTKERNAILLYIQIQPSRLAMIGDVGFHFLIQKDWHDWTNQLVQYFQKSEFQLGISSCLENILIKVQPQFPYQLDDQNELPNQISSGI